MPDDLFEKPAPDENVLRPISTDLAARRKASARIHWFISTHLKHLGTADGGWSKLYRDPDSGVYWELTHPDGAQHGGGAPELRAVAFDGAKDKYGLGG